MSYYDKKILKGDSKKDRYDDECKKDRCNDECEKDNHKHHYVYEKDEEHGLLTEFDVDQFPLNPTSTVNPNLNTNAFAEVSVCVDDPSCDRVSLHATIEWTPNLLSLAGLPVGTVLTGLFLNGIPAVFRIWRKSSSGTTLISQKTDTSPISALPLVAGIPTFVLATTTLPFATTTTSIHAVDPNPPAGTNEYFLTIQLGTLPTGLLPALITLITGTGALTPNNVSSWTFSASEIEANE